MTATESRNARRRAACCTAAGLVAALTGCANFHAAADFADATQRLTGTARTELVQLQTLCSAQALTSIVAAARDDDAPLEDCARYRAAEGRLAKVTLDVLDGYAKALAALAEDKSFDVSKDLSAAATRLRQAKDADGRLLIPAPEAAALVKLADLLTSLALESRRADALARLAAQKDDVATAGRVLRAFFVAPADAPADHPPTPYDRLVRLSAGDADSTARLLASRAMREAEPLRSRELSREVAARQALYGPRRSKDGAPAEVPAKMAAAIDAWRAALDEFSAAAARPAPREWLARLRELGAKTRDAEEAVTAAGD